MVPTIRLTNLFVLLFLITGRLSIVHSQQDGNASRGDDAISAGVELAARENQLLRGRKMMINNVMRLEKMEENASSGGTSKISSAKQRVQGVANLNGRGQQSVDVAGFVAFSADYHTPKHHPPKNN